jgi:hypothetical protein
MNTKHTPGKWIATKDHKRGWNVGAKTGEWANRTDILESVAHCENENAEANAKLIAAAPELLELAKQIEAQDEFTCDESASIPMRQAYAIINAWREAAKSALKTTK